MDAHRSRGSRYTAFTYSNAFFCHSSRSRRVVSPVVPHTCQDPGFHASILCCKTTYSTTSFSLPDPGTTSTSPPLSFLDLVNFCLEHICMIACLTAAPSIGSLAPRCDTILGLLLYFTSSHCTVSPRGRFPIRARKLSYMPSVHILRSKAMSPSAKEVYICRWRATAVGLSVDLRIFRLRLRKPFSFGEENLRTMRENRSRRRYLMRW